MKALLVFLLSISLLPAAEKILSFKSHIKVNEDGWLDVTETIKVHVEGNEIKRGIFRDFPQTYKTRWGFRQKRPFDVVSVKRNGEEEPFHSKQINMGTRLMIGSATKFLDENTDQEYEIKYRTNFQLITGVDGLDELNWNVTGNEWAFPIEEIEAIVELPEGIEIGGTKAWTGENGEKGDAYEAKHEGSRAEFKSTRTMQRKEGMTISVTWPTGKLDPVAYRQPSLFKDNPALIIGMFLVGLGVIFYFVMWFLVGRDPPKGVIIPRWEPPKGFTPGGVRFLRNLRFDNTCFSAGTLGLAAEGHLKMHEKKKKYSVTKEDGPPPMDPVSGTLFKKLFRYKKKVVLGQSAHKTIRGARKAYEKALTGKIDRSYFLANFKAWLPGLILGILGILLMILGSANGKHTILSFVFFLFMALVTFAPISTMLFALQSRGIQGFKEALRDNWFVLILWGLGFGVLVFNTGLWIGIFFPFVFLVSFLFNHLMKRPTKRGRAIMDEIEGFREYLKVAEEDRLNLENPPEKTPELFEKFLPYALALDVEQEWSEKFDDILKKAGKEQGKSTYRPSYYTGNFSNTGQALGAAALGGALTSALTTASTAPTSSSSGGGGGGFSGGGGGGGGGGGW